ncbi:uncharacterized protein LOC117597637 [Pangasianodon hypophthalmus]|uniref:uncharacterized protein LOC117597637 n=1 Tax=Pangasianodon hypophthalmus TaxID=310915 RepID=UPI00147DC11B|nr:uncharacterized protein LOC117597637 [Pangasianodon hypophthalmus]
MPPCDRLYHLTGPKNHIRAVLQMLLQNHLYVKAEKCEFHVTTISFLGFILSASSIQMDPACLQAEKDWPCPEFRKQMQSFLSIANFYRRFIRGYSSVATPLHQLTSSLRMFILVTRGRAGLSVVKGPLHFGSCPVLTFPSL